MVSIIKGTNSKIKFTIYDNFQTRNPIDLSSFNEFICAITENGRLLIEEKYSSNNIFVIDNIINVQIKKEDTENLGINPSTEERQRTLELFGIDINESVTRFIITDFYLEGSGYYVCRNRN